MALYWNPWSLAGISAWFLGWILAVLVYAARPRSLQNRSLALFLALCATGFGVGVGWMFAATDAQTSLALQATSLAGFYASTPVYLLFLSTLPSRATRWLRPKPVRALLIGWAIAAPFLAVAYFDLLVGGVVEVPYAKQDSYWTPLGTRLFEAHSILTATLGVVAAVDAWRVAAPGSFARVQAKWYMSAFIIWEIAQLSAFTLIEVAFSQAAPDVRLYTAAAAVILPAAVLLLMLMMAYGLLKFQLFSLDLRIKVGLTRSMVVAPFAIAFFVVTETLEGLLPFDSYWAGLAAAGALSLLIVPLQRKANHLADRLMPGVHDERGYLDTRKETLYMAAVEGAWTDGDPTEIAVLRRIQERLGLDAKTARLLEAKALGKAQAET